MDVDSSTRGIIVEIDQHPYVLFRSGLRKGQSGANCISLTDGDKRVGHCSHRGGVRATIKIEALHLFFGGACGSTADRSGVSVVELRFWYIKACRKEKYRLAVG